MVPDLRHVVLDAAASTVAAAGTAAATASAAAAPAAAAPAAAATAAALGVDHALQLLVAAELLQHLHCGLRLGGRGAHADDLLGDPRIELGLGQ
eukprot:14845728-Heterocapsa_arctica.AAC.1